MKSYELGYVPGAFDMFHIGHLNLLRRAKAQCARLMVAVSTDELVASFKKKRAVIPFGERVQIVEAIRFVDRVVPQESMDKLAAWRAYGFDAIFVGDDWKGSDTWRDIEAALAPRGVSIVYFPYTTGTSSTLLASKLSTL